jgi:hypothetical protein
MVLSAKVAPLLHVSPMLFLRLQAQGTWAPGATYSRQSSYTSSITMQTCSLHERVMHSSLDGFRASSVCQFNGVQACSGLVPCITCARMPFDSRQVSDYVTVDA